MSMDDGQSPGWEKKPTSMIVVVSIDQGASRRNSSALLDVDGDKKPACHKKSRKQDHARMNHGLWLVHSASIIGMIVVIRTGRSLC